MTRSLMLKTSLVWALMSGGAFAADDLNKGKKDDAFIQDASANNLALIRMSQLALAQSSEPSVKQLAQEMIDEHTRSNDALKDLCASKGLTFPSSQTIAPAAQKKYDELIKVQTGSRFDRIYLSGLIGDHKKAIKLFERESKYGEDADLRKWASTTLPALQAHLESAQALEKAFKDRRPVF